MSVLASIFGGGKSSSARLPTGETVAEWQKAVELERGAGYVPLVSLLVSHYQGQGRADTVKALARAFPQSYDRIVPVMLPVLRKLVNERAQVFGGEGESFAWLSGDDDAPDESFADAVERSGLAHALKAVDRRVELANRAFVRVTWDEREGRVKLTVFTPDAVFPRWPADTRDLDACVGVLFVIDPIVEGGSKVERWEFWSPEHNVIVDGKGRVTQREGEPYTYDDGTPCVPVVSFGAESDDVGGYWLPPREDWLETQRGVNVGESALMHLSRMAGFGQWIIRRTDQNSDPFPAQTVIGPDELPEVPFGWDMSNTPVNADFAGLRAVAVEHLKQVTSLNDLPPGSVMAEARAVPSGVALQIERAPLMETREDRASVYAATVARLLEVMRVVHNTHCAAGDEVGEGWPRWTPGDVSPPSDPEAQRRLDEADIRMGVSSPVRVLMRDHGMDRDAARLLLQEIREDGVPVGRPGNTPASMGNAAGAGAASVAALMGAKKDVTFFQYELEGGVVTLNEARANKGLPPLAQDGDLTLPQYRAKYPAIFAANAVTQASGSAEKVLGMGEEAAKPAGNNPFLDAPASPLTQAREG